MKTTNKREEEGCLLESSGAVLRIIGKSRDKAGSAPDPGLHLGEGLDLATPSQWPPCPPTLQVHNADTAHVPTLSNL